MNNPVNFRPCPCDSGLTYPECCGALHSGCISAATAVELMRSRYSAFVLGLTDYLVASWHPETRPGDVQVDEKQRWIGLRIKSLEGGKASDNAGFVEFVARYKVDGKAHRLHENSRFSRSGGRWYYVDGEILEAT